MQVINAQEDLELPQTAQQHVETQLKLELNNVTIEIELDA
jgi:hypothetical protein